MIYCQYIFNKKIKKDCFYFIAMLLFLRKGCGKMSFGKRLRSAIKYKNTTQKELAKILNTTPQSISQYVSGKRNPKKDTVAKLANALQLGYTYTKSGEAYFYTFIDAVSSSEYEVAEKFNQEQYQDALENALEDVTMAKIGEQIEKLRKERGLTQKELGILVGLSQQQVEQYESGKVTLRADTTSRIAHVLGIADEYQLYPEYHSFKKELLDYKKQMTSVLKNNENSELFEDAKKVIQEIDSILASLKKDYNALGMQEIIEEESKNLVFQKQIDAITTDPSSLKTLVDTVKKVKKHYGVSSSLLASVSKDIQKIKNIQASTQKYINVNTLPSDNTDIIELSLADIVLLNIFHSLNEHGQDKIIIYLDDIAGNPKYRADSALGQDETAQDETVSSKQEEPDKNQ